MASRPDALIYCSFLDAYDKARSVHRSVYHPSNKNHRHSLNSARD